MDAPLVSANGIWYAYFTENSYPGDNLAHQLELNAPGTYGNTTLFSDADGGVAMTHRSLVSVDVHAKCKHEVAIERALLVQLDKGASGGLLERGEANFVAGTGNSAYQGILEAGHLVRAAVSAPGDKVEITSGYISVIAQPV